MPRRWSERSIPTPARTAGLHGSHRALAQPRCCLPIPMPQCRAATCPCSSKGARPTYATRGQRRTESGSTSLERHSCGGSLTATPDSPAARFPTARSGTASYPSTGAGSFAGYTKGPGYYGKTFFIWPPDPRAPLNTGTNTGWSTTSQDATQIKQFLTDFGYTAADFNCTAVATTLSAGITKTATSITVNIPRPNVFQPLPFMSL